MQSMVLVVKKAMKKHSLPCQRTQWKQVWVRDVFGLTVSDVSARWYCSPDRDGRAAEAPPTLLIKEPAWDWRQSSCSLQYLSLLSGLLLDARTCHLKVLPPPYK